MCVVLDWTIRAFYLNHEEAASPVRVQTDAGPNRGNNNYSLLLRTYSASVAVVGMYLGKRVRDRRGRYRKEERKRNPMLITLGQQSSATKAAFLNLSISRNRNHPKNHIPAPTLVLLQLHSHSHSYRTLARIRIDQIRVHIRARTLAHFHTYTFSQIHTQAHTRIRTYS